MKGWREGGIGEWTWSPGASSLLAWCARAQAADIGRARWRSQEILHPTAVGAQNENSPRSTLEARPLRGVWVRMPPERAPCARGQWVLLHVQAYRRLPLCSLRRLLHGSISGERKAPGDRRRSPRSSRRACFNGPHARGRSRRGARPLVQIRVHRSVEKSVLFAGSVCRFAQCPWHVGGAF